jgi:hypothetical protein
MRPGSAKWNLVGRIERQVMARGVFTSVEDLSRKLMRYVRACSKVHEVSGGSPPSEGLAFWLWWVR